MRDFILMHYLAIKLILSYLSYFFIALITISFIPICWGEFQLIRIQYIRLKKLELEDQSFDQQLISIKDRVSALQTTIHAALELPSISDNERSEMLTMLKASEIIAKNAPLLPEFIEDYLCDLYDFAKRLQEIVPPTLYPLNPNFTQTTPPGLEPIQWAKRNVLHYCLIPHFFGMMTFAALIHGVRHPLGLNISFIPIVFLGFFTFGLYHKLHKKSFLKYIDEDSLKCYEFGYRYVFTTVLLTLILYIIIRFLVFGM